MFEKKVTETDALKKQKLALLDLNNPSIRYKHWRRVVVGNLLGK